MSLVYPKALFLFIALGLLCLVPSWAESSITPSSQSPINKELKITAPPGGVQTKWLFYKPTKYLKIKEYNIHILGTASVSDWMMLSTHELIRNMVGSLKRPQDRAAFSGHQAFVITDADLDLSKSGGVSGQRNTGMLGASLFNECLVCAKAVDTIRPAAAPEYRGWDTPVHEFGHAIEHTLKLEKRSDGVFSKTASGYDVKVSREYFAWTTQSWFSIKPGARESMKSQDAGQYAYFGSIFSEDNKWNPSSLQR